MWDITKTVQNLRNSGLNSLKIPPNYIFVYFSLKFSLIVVLQGIAVEQELHENVLVKVLNLLLEFVPAIY